MLEQLVNKEVCNRIFKKLLVLRNKKAPMHEYMDLIKADEDINNAREAAYVFIQWTKWLDTRQHLKDVVEID